MNDHASNTISLRTANVWMHVLGFSADKAAKRYYIDSHNRQDVNDYRDDIFLPRMQKYEERMNKE